MGKALDEETLHMMLSISIVVTSVVAMFSLYGRFVVLPRLQAITGDAAVPSLWREVGGTLAWMALGTTLLTYPITLLTNEENESHESSTSSINFCEKDFEHTPWIAEPANTISNLFAYLPLAAIGLLKGGSSLRFQACYITIGMVGVGSTLLHSCLTAMTQGGDELPMLWFTAATSYCGFNVLFSSGNKLVGPAVLLSSIVATTVYAMFRANYFVFALMFDTYTIVLVISLVHITLFKKWSTDDDKNNGASSTDGTRKTSEISAERFQQFVLYPLGQAAAWTLIPAVWFWVSEMIYCNDIVESSVVAQFLWNRCWHPLWHYLTANLAMLVVQILYAADGFVTTGCMPRIVSYGVPLVVFDEIKKKKE